MMGSIRMKKNYVVEPTSTVVVTGAAGFIGSRIVASLLRLGFDNIRCLVRPTSNVNALQQLRAEYPDARIAFERGNLLSQDDCKRLVAGASVVLHLAAGRKSLTPTPT
jgi:nucleoside-diphosphate-sugar epimerase